MPFPPTRLMLRRDLFRHFTILKASVALEEFVLDVLLEGSGMGEERGEEAGTRPK